METPPQIPDLTLLRRIGGGSYGDVWLARTLTGVFRAVKVIDRRRFADERPFLRELDGITQFQRMVGDRPRQLALMHVGRIEATGLLYYVMELADDLATGTDIDPERYVPLTLRALHSRQPIMPAAECVRLGVEIARSLVELHSAGLIHRDVKLSNIIFVGGVPKLADIGLVASTDHTMTSLGTPGYVPPEGAGTVSADVYGLGKVLYEIATGFSPGAFPRLPADLDRRQDVAALLELNEVILHACEPDPRKRYASVDELLDHLLLLQAGKSVKELQRTRERLGTARRAAGVTVLIGLVVAGVLGVENHLNLRKLAVHEAEARRRAEEDEKFALYVNDLRRAERALHHEDVGQARAALRRHIPAAGGRDRRGLEWNALWHETAGEELRSLGTVGGPPVWAIALSPDGTTLAAQEGGEPGQTVSWDLRSGSRTLLASDTRGLGGFSHDGRRLAVGTVERGLRWLDLAAPAMSGVQNPGGRIAGWLEDGCTAVLVASESPRIEIVLLDVAAAHPVARWESEATFGPARLIATATTPDGRRLAVSLQQADRPAPEHELQVWTRGEAWTCSFRRRDLTYLRCLQFSDDGRLLAAVGPETPLAIIDTGDGRTLRELPDSGDTACLAFSPDGSLLAAAGENQVVHVVRTGDGSRVNSLHGHEAPVTAILWDGPDRLITGSFDGTIREWKPRLESRRLAQGGFWDDYLGDFCFAPDGATILVTDQAGRLSEIDAQTLQPTGRIFDAFQPIGCAGDSVLALTRELELAVCNLTTGAVARKGLRVEPSDRPIMTGASGDGRHVMIVMRDGTVVFWDGLEARPIGRTKRHNAAIFGCAVSSDGTLAASGDVDGVVWLWDPRDGRALHGLFDNSVRVFTVAVSADGHVAVGREDGSLTVYDAATRAVVAQRTAHSRGVAALSYSPDGSRLITAGYDGLLIAWAVPDYREVTLLPVQPMDEAQGVPDLRPTLVRFPADGTRMAAFTEAGCIRCWDLTRPEL